MFWHSSSLDLNFCERETRLLLRDGLLVTSQYLNSYILTYFKSPNHLKWGINITARDIKMIDPGIQIGLNHIWIVTITKRNEIFELRSGGYKIIKMQVI